MQHVRKMRFYTSVMITCTSARRSRARVQRGHHKWAVSPERGIFRPPPRSHLGETHANVACQCVGSATRCGHQLRVKPKVHEDGLRYNA